MSCAGNVGDGDGIQANTQWGPGVAPHALHAPPVSPAPLASLAPSAPAPSTKWFLGIGELTCGALLLLFQSCVVVMTSYSNFGSHFKVTLGTGIWCGAIFIFTGILGCRCAYKATKGVLIPFLIFTIISSILAGFSLFWTSLYLAVTVDQRGPSLLTFLTALEVACSLAEVIFFIWSLVDVSIAIHRINKINDGLESPRYATNVVVGIPHDVRHVLAAKTTMFLGVGHVVFGGVLIILGVAGAAAFSSTPYSEWSIGYGIWGGLFILVNGILGCCAASKKTAGLVISFLVLSVFGLVNSILVLVFASVDIAWAASADPYMVKSIKATSALILIFALFDFALCIWSIVIMAIAIRKSKINCCHCCCCHCCCAYRAPATEPVVAINIQGVPSNVGTEQAPGMWYGEKARNMAYNRH